VAALAHRLLHLTAHMNLFVPVLMALAALLLKPRADGAGQTRAGLAARPLRLILLLLATNALLFSVLGGALLTRYLLPLFPLVLLLAVTTLYRRAPYWPVLAAVSATAFALGCVLNPPYGFAPEDNLAYARIVRLEQQGIAELERRDPAATVLAAWPMTDELTRPELGYVEKPFAVYRLEDYSAEQVARAATQPQKYSAALVFSTKYDPPSLLAALGVRSEALEERYFGLHHDLQPDEIARRLGGRLEWQGREQGQWVALIDFSR
jgi:hypothetical protein